MNIKKLERLHKHVLRSSKSFDMAHWGMLKKSRTGHICGTVACIAGKAAILEGAKIIFDGVCRFPNEQYTSSIERVATAALELTYEQQQWLFYAAWRWMPLPQIDYKLAAASIAALIEADGNIDKATKIMMAYGRPEAAA